MRVPRAGKVAGIVLLLAAAAGLAAVYTRNNREVTTSSEEAYQAWREAIENERRFYFKEARVGFARALQLDPQFAMAMIGLARNSDREQRIALTRRAGRERGRLTEHERLHVDMQQAMIDMDQKRYVETAKKIHEKYPNDIRAAMVLARQQIDTGKMDDAFQIFGDLLAVEPNNADAYNQIGYYYGYRGDYDKAIENLKKYQFMAPDQANPYDSLGEIQAYSGHYDEAIENLQKALALKPDFFESYNHLGVAYEGKGDVDRGGRELRARVSGIRDVRRRPDRVSDAGFSSRGRGGRRSAGASAHFQNGRAPARQELRRAVRDRQGVHGGGDRGRGGPAGRGGEGSPRRAAQVGGRRVEAAEGDDAETVLGDVEFLARANAR